MDHRVLPLTMLHNVDSVAGRMFATAGGMTVNHIARWNGTAWSPLGLGVSGGVYALATLANRDLVAGGSFHKAADYLSRYWARLVCARLGDLNCDGSVDMGDIDPFVLALSGQATYEQVYPDCRYLNADCSEDGVVDFGDIEAFVALLMTP